MTSDQHINDIEEPLVDAQDEDQSNASQFSLDSVDVENLTSVRALSEVPVALEFCFPSQRMTLGELSNLACGSSIKVNCQLEDRLTIRVNGRVVGGGHLVDLDGILGLKVTDWALKPEDTQASEPSADTVGVVDPVGAD